MKANRRRTKTLEKWAKRIRDWKSSGKEAIEWCRKKDISYTYFITWRKHLERMSAEEVSPMFMEVQNEKAPEPIEVHFHGFTVTVPEQFDPQTLLNCLRVLRSL